MGTRASALTLHSHNLASEDSDTEYPIKCILDESENKYLIAWEGDYKPTWEPKHFVNHTAVLAWELRKSRRYRAAEIYCSNRAPRLSRPIYTNHFSRAAISAASSPCSDSGSPSSSGSIYVPHPTQQSLSSLYSQALSQTSSSRALSTKSQGHPQQFSISSKGCQPDTADNQSLELLSTTESLPFSDSSYLPSVSSHPTADLLQSTLAPPSDRQEIPETPLSRLLVDRGGELRTLLETLPAISQLEASSDLDTHSAVPSRSPGFLLTTSRLSTQTIPETIYSSTNSASPIRKRNTTGFSVLLEQTRARTDFSLNVCGDHILNMESSSSGQPPGNQSSQSASQATAYIERMTRLRASERASIKPLQSLTGSATPSSAGDIEASTPPINPEGVMPLSVRHDRVVPATESPVPFVAPQALHYNPNQPALLGDTGVKLLETSDLSAPVQSLELAAENLEHSDSSLVEGKKGIPLGDHEFVILLSMDSRVKDDYDRTLQNASKGIEKFVTGISSVDLTGNTMDADSLLLQMYATVENLSNIATHPDLNLPEQPTTGSSDFEKEASWAEYSSAKFQFLGYFIERALHDPLARQLHIIVMVKPGIMVDILRNYFLGKGFNSPPQEPQLMFLLQHLCFEIRTTQGLTPGPPSTPSTDPAMILALDSSFDINCPSVQGVRATSSSTTGIPIIRLLISNSIEHIMLCLPRWSEPERLRLLIQQTVSYADTVGDLQEDALGVQENAEETFQYITSDPDTRIWPLAEVEALDIPTIDTEKPRTVSSSTQKRWLEDEGDEIENASKRQRVMSYQDTDNTSGAVGDQTHAQVGQVGAPGEIAREVDRLRDTLESTTKRLQEMESNFAKLQYRYEAKYELYFKTRRELAEAVESSKKSAARIEKQKEELLKTREENSALVKELQEARDALKAGGGLPADLENAREEVRQLSQQKSTLERTSQQSASQLDFTRQQYQTASTAAAQANMETQQLKEQVKELTQKSSGEARKLKELREVNMEKAHLERIRELEMVVLSREKILKSKEEEIRELRKNRPTTRSTSTQPRSPKIAGQSRPASPAPNSNNVGRGSVLRYRLEP